MFNIIKNYGRRLAVVGHVKIGFKGDKKKTANNVEFRLPKKYDHFVVVTRETDDSDNFKTDTELMGRLGNHSMELDILLLSDQIELNFQYFLAAYSGPRMYCTGNGKEAIRYDEKRVESKIVCDMRTCPIFLGNFKKQNIQCKPQGRLYFILTQKKMLGGVYSFKTTSWETIRNIVSSLEFIRAISGGVISGIPLKLKLYPVRDNTINGQVTNYKVTVVYEGDPHSLRQAVLLEHQLRESSRIDRKALEEEYREVVESHVDSPEEEARTAEEFYPAAVGAREEEDPEPVMPVDPKPVPTGNLQRLDIAASAALPVTDSGNGEIAPADPLPLAAEDPRRFVMTGKIDADLETVFDLLNMAPAIRKGQLGFMKNDKPGLLNRLTQTLVSRGYEIVQPTV